MTCKIGKDDWHWLMGELFGERGSMPSYLLSLRELESGCWCDTLLPGVTSKVNTPSTLVLLMIAMTTITSDTPFLGFYTPSED